MQQLVDYIRASATTHPRAAIDQQLRTAGYDSSTIDQAWAYAHTGAAPASAATVAATTTAPGMAIHTPQRRQDPRLLIAIACIACIAAAAFVYQRATADDVRAIPASELQQTEIMQELTKDTGVTAQDLEENTSMVDGALDASKLPDGWKAVEDGMWGDTVSLNNVSVRSLPSEGLDAMAAATATATVYDGLDAARVVEQPRAAELNGTDAVRIKTEMTVSGVTVDQFQWFVEADDDITVVTATTARTSSDADMAEVDDVVDLVRVG